MHVDTNNETLEDSGEAWHYVGDARFSLLVLGLLDIQEGCHGHLVGGKATLGPGLACKIQETQLLA